MKTILVTGATGNVGLEVLRALSGPGCAHRILAGVRNPEKDAATLSAFGGAVSPVAFDFEQASSYTAMLADCEIVFLLRPPQIADVGKYFKPLIDTAARSGVRHIVFLSVQGVERSSIIPHHKIEALIVASGIPYTFLRPAYFMQNFNTTLRTDVAQHRRIFLPAGRAPFTLVDVRDIGRVAAVVLNGAEAHAGMAYELTSADRLTFAEMAEVLSAALKVRIGYESPNLLRFILAKRREGMALPFIMVMIMLHYLPRFQKPPQLTDWVEKLSGTKPIPFTQYAKDYSSTLSGNAGPK